LQSQSVERRIVKRRGISQRYARGDELILLSMIEISGWNCK
jgi:hypothetical protein